MLAGPIRALAWWCEPPSVLEQRLIDLESRSYELAMRARVQVWWRVEHCAVERSQVSLRSAKLRQLREEPLSGANRPGLIEAF